jgi:hypothetical protein
MTDRQEGWAQFDNWSKFHYMQYGLSLCGRVCGWSIFTITPENDDRCKICARMVADCRHLEQREER